MKRPLLSVLRILVSCGALISATVDAQTSVTPPGTIEIVSATITTRDVVSPGAISPERCTVAEPCPGLKRGSTLVLTIGSRGYAAAYLQDQEGRYYKQEGRDTVSNATVGRTALWPGIPSRIDHAIFRLYVVTSPHPIHPSSDSLGLATLPDGKPWGPIYLRIAAE